MFESQTKIKLGSLQMAPEGESINKYVGDFVKLEVDNYLHIHADVAEVMQQKITESRAYSSLRATQPADQSPRAATSTPRRCSRCEANLSTHMD